MISSTTGIGKVFPLDANRVLNEFVEPKSGDRSHSWLAKLIKCGAVGVEAPISPVRFSSKNFRFPAELDIH